MKIREDFTCPLELVHDMIKGKWKPIILWRLRLGPASLSQLERGIEGITQKMLLEHLKELIEFGFVEKKSYEGYPLHVEYFLTEPQGNKQSKELSCFYGGMTPPDQAHTYELHVFALDCLLHLETGFLLNELYHKMEGHVLAQAKLCGIYEKV